ncbi:hypothetical protein HMPREF9374_3380 [Desmospora sp. 8437]|nr:hypothetical protein HMPREF9374_3380 [Desmospora sp. 8437]
MESWIEGFPAVNDGFIQKIVHHGTWLLRKHVLFLSRRGKR